MADLDKLDLFYGATNAARSQVYARLPRPEEPGEWTLAGRLRGPNCAIAETLPATIEFRDLGPGPTLLAGATLADPCFWSPRLPAWYQARLELRHNGQAVAKVERMFGVRMLGASGRSLYLEGRRWVLRGVHWKSTSERELSRWREQSAAVWIEAPNDALCEEASQQGALVVAVLPGDDAAILSQLRRLARWPAVAMAAIVRPSRDVAELRAAAPNLLLGAWQSSGESSGSLSGADVRFVPWSDEAAGIAAWSAKTSQPLIAARPLAGPLPLNDARRACDRLQADLAAVMDCAGYCV